ncbi:MAG TPA: glycosyltransferase family 1 protein, partial [bacterium]|nr:glycosyltransferase family 1 protein [bacterium]
AAGRPVVVQDTGFSKIIPTGEGVFAFSGQQEAIQAIEAIENNYEMHCKSAAAIARDHFSAKKVLGELLNEIH